VLAIIITIMVLELKVPYGQGLDELMSLLPSFLSYILSFPYVGIYCNNHHHLLHTVHKITGAMMWANLHLLFWISLFPFATSWMGPILVYFVATLIAFKLPWVAQALYVFIAILWIIPDRRVEKVI